MKAVNGRKKQAKVAHLLLTPKVQFIYPARKVPLRVRTKDQT